MDAHEKIFSILIEAGKQSNNPAQFIDSFAYSHGNAPTNSMIGQPISSRDFYTKFDNIEFARARRLNLSGDQFVPISDVSTFYDTYLGNGNYSKFQNKMTEGLIDHPQEAAQSIVNNKPVTQEPHTQLKSPKKTSAPTSTSAMEEQVRKLWGQGVTDSNVMAAKLHTKGWTANAIDTYISENIEDLNQYRTNVLAEEKAVAQQRTEQLKAEAKLERENLQKPLLDDNPDVKAAREQYSAYADEAAEYESKSIRKNQIQEQAAAKREWRTKGRFEHDVTREERAKYNKLKKEYRKIQTDIQDLGDISELNITQQKHLEALQNRASEIEEFGTDFNTRRKAGITKDAAFRKRQAESMAKYLEKGHGASRLTAEELGEARRVIDHQYASGARGLARAERAGTGLTAKASSKMGWKGRAGIFTVAALATTAVAGMMFAGGKRDNAQLYNPNAAFQYA